MFGNNVCCYPTLVNSNVSFDLKALIFFAYKHRFKMNIYSYLRSDTNSCNKYMLISKYRPIYIFTIVKCFSVSTWFFSTTLTSFILCLQQARYFTDISQFLIPKIFAAFCILYIIPKMGL